MSINALYELIDKIRISTESKASLEVKKAFNFQKQLESNAVVFFLNSKISLLLAKAECRMIQGTEITINAIKDNRLAIFLGYVSKVFDSK